MLEFQVIRSQYPENLQRFERAILREYLQYKILQVIFDSHHAARLSFLGGTALRIVHGSTRFSEDIDLDMFGLEWAEFEEVMDRVQRYLKLEGFLVEVKNVRRGAYHCHLRFPGLLYQQGLSPFPDEKILVQVDTAAQGYSYKPDIRLLNKFDVFTEIRVTPLPVLLSQKIFTAVNRGRPTGRDFYDITVLAGRTKPEYGFLAEKMAVHTPEELKRDLSSRIADYDFASMAKDVAPFLINQQEIRRVERFREFWEQLEL